jgi:hypothetical protein
MSEEIRIGIGPVTFRCQFSVTLNGREDLNLLADNCQRFKKEFPSLQDAIAFLQTHFGGVE